MRAYSRYLPKWHVGQKMNMGTDPVAFLRRLYARAETLGNSVDQIRATIVNQMKDEACKL